MVKASVEENVIRNEESIDTIPSDRDHVVDIEQMENLDNEMNLSDEELFSWLTIRCI